MRKSNCNHIPTDPGENTKYLKSPHRVIPSWELAYPPIKALLKMIFSFPRWDMWSFPYIPWWIMYIYIYIFICFQILHQPPRFLFQPFLTPETSQQSFGFVPTNSTMFHQQKGFQVISKKGNFQEGDSFDEHGVFQWFPEACATFLEENISVVITRGPSEFWLRFICCRLMLSFAYKQRI